MSDLSTYTDDSELEDEDEQQQPQQRQQSEGSRLRQELEAAKAEAKTLRQALRTERFHRAGINPDEGVGKLLAQAYDGEPDVDKIREFAQEYGVTPQSSGEGEGQPPAELSDEERERQGAQQRLEQMQSGSESGAKPLSRDDQIREAEKAGDWDTFNRLQAEALFDRS